VSVRLFAYGSNMASAEMSAWCPAHRLLGPARLPGFRLELRRRSRRWRGGAADLVEAAGEEVWGALYELDAAALDRLDAKEGAGFAYRRVPVTVELGGERLPALAYAVIDKEPAELPCTPAYAELLVTGARERGLPADYVARLERRLAHAPRA
jgi:gamma-glutamylcyclotransferase (GGCT)/AIG2-like uncharacterized protein YtfP